MHLSCMVFHARREPRLKIGFLSNIQQIGPTTLEDIQPETLFDVLREWGNTWMWRRLKLVGEEEWVIDAIRAGSLVAVTDGSYIRELYPNLCSCAFVLECSEGRGRIFGDFPEKSKVALVHTEANCWV